MRTTIGTLIGGGLVMLHVGVVAMALAGPAWLFVETFRDGDGWALTAWRNVFGDLDRWGVLLANTAAVAVWALVPSMLVGIAMALILFKIRGRLRVPMMALLLLAATMPLYAVSGWMYGVVGIERWLGSTAMVGLIHGVAHLPLVVLIVGVAVRSVDADLEEAALVEGADTVGVLFRVTLRRAIAGLVTAGVLVVLWVVTDYSVSDVLQVRTFAEEVYTQYALHGRPQEPTLVSLPQILLFGGLLWAWRRHYLIDESVPNEIGARRRFSAGRFGFPLTAAAGVVAVALAALPLVSLGRRLTGQLDLWTLASSFSPELRVSLTTSSAAGAIAAALAVGLAWAIVRPTRWRLPLAACVVLLLAVPGPVLGIGIVRVMTKLATFSDTAATAYDSPGILVAAYVFRFLPVAVILLVPAVRAIPIECELAARVDGCGSTRVWWHIVWPRCLPTALMAAFVVMILALGELPCSILVTPPGYDTVGKRFFSLVHYGLYPDAAMLCLLSLASVVGPWMGLVVLLRKWLFGEK
ncbi:MAG: iron ABC transporter permease [Phycisphaerae bacterium]|nr:iron ABC transporter permease [Phycisphaerae bacterium]